MAKITDTDINHGANPQLKGTIPTQADMTEKGDSGIATSRSHRIRSLEDLMEYFKIDPLVWSVDRVITNNWEVGSKIDGIILVEPLFQIKAFLKRRSEVVETRAAILAMIEDAKAHAPAYPEPIQRFSRKKGSGNLLEISPCDLHLGKMCDIKETGAAYDIKLAKSVFMRALDDLIDRSSSVKYDGVLLILGNDLMNVDGHDKMTTAGTPQDECGRWQRTFAAARKLMVKAIDKLRDLAPVKVVIVSGNHDMERAHYLGEVLSAWYSNCKDVEIDCGFSLRKYHRHGDVLLGFTHGDKEPTKSLPLIMATERAKDWGETKFREIHTGHFHRKGEMEFTSVNEISSCRVRHLPSLSARCAWATSKGYSALRAAEAYIWNSKLGYVGHFSSSPK